MLELEHRFRVVDMHGHLDHDEVSVSTRGRDMGPDRLARECHQAGVVQTAVSPTRRPDDIGYLRANNAVARLSVDRPFLAFARLNGALAAADNPISKLRNLYAPRKNHHTRPGDVEQYAYDDRFHGFVLDPVVDGLPDREVRDELIAVDLPVVVYCRPDYPPAAVADTLLNDGYPVIMAGFGGYPMDEDRMETALTLLDRYDHLYLDTWTVRSREILERGLLEHPDRIVFGSGTPDVHPNVAVMEILTLDVPEDAMSRVFNKNPTRIIPGLSTESGF
ncbi:amidohydrolase [Halonotius terrestris]|uniref:Amidohydrolase n=1 Tax=Halonotius terrestris TaxID=2487750 RepID=A0A8J8TBX5_9EURY|nr:amidohydrolase [Halonotius terrestris]TQQ82830.1 amidohydrolase [Halonotius terrestris]